jgi:hypothetical protein
MRSAVLVAVAGLGVAAMLLVGSDSPEASPSDPAATPGRLVIDAPVPQRRNGLRRRLVVLDASGKTHHSGARGGTISAVAICPGSRYLMVVQDGPRQSSWTYLYVRRLDSLRKVRKIRLPIGVADGSFFGSIACTERHGRRGVVFISQESLNDDRSRLLRVRGRHLRTIHRGRFSDAYLTPKTAFMISTEYYGRPHGGPRRVVAVRLRDGDARLVTSLPWAPQSAAASPDGRSLAVIIQPTEATDTEDLTRPPKLYLFDALTGARQAVVQLPGFPAAVGDFDPAFSDRPQPASPCPPVCQSGRAVWVSNDLVAFVPSVVPGKATYLFTRRGDARGELPGLHGGHPALLGDRLYTIAGNATVNDPYAPSGLRTARLPDEEAQELVKLTTRKDNLKGVNGPELLVAAP